MNSIDCNKFKCKLKNSPKGKDIGFEGRRVGEVEISVVERESTHILRWKGHEFFTGEVARETDLRSELDAHSVQNVDRCCG